MHRTKILHLGCYTTQRVEGAHAKLKEQLQRVVSLPVAMDIIDPWLQQKVTLHISLPCRFGMKLT
jgi:hypothetical protein